MPYGKHWLGVLVACASLWGCAASPKPVQSVAAYDLSCDRVEISRIDDTHYAASGCGRGAVYTEECEGGTCRWARLRHGHEVDVAGRQEPPPVAPPPREVIPAPAPEQREVLPAPPPGDAAPREVIPAPPPASSAGTSGGEAPQTSAEGAVAGQTQALAADQTQAAQEPVLSEPYQATVPEYAPQQQVAYEPPAPIVETRPPPPQVTYVWVGGYWWYGPSWGWTWVPGYWCPPRPGYVWLTGGWYWANNWWWYHPGGWGYPGTTRVVYRPSPRPSRVVEVRTIRPTPVSPGRGGATASAGGAIRPRPPAASGSYRPTVSPLYSSRRPATLAGERRISEASRGNTLPRPPGRVVNPNQAVPARNSYGTLGAPNNLSVRPQSTERFARPMAPSQRYQPSLRSERPLRSVSPSTYPTRVTPSRPLSTPRTFSSPSRSSPSSRAIAPSSSRSMSSPSRSAAPSRSFSPSRSMGGSARPVSRPR